MIKVSVIVPVYNIENYVKKCLDSLFNQTLKDIEVIIVDDCSTDSSPRICDEYVEKGKAIYGNNIYVIHKEINGGIAATRNTALTCCRGKYIYFLDGDDYIEATFLENLVIKMESNFGVDTVCTGYSVVSEEGELMEIEKPILWPQEYISQEEIFDKVIETLFVSKNDLEYFISHNESYYDAVHKHKQMGSLWRFLFSKNVLDDNELKFEGKVRRGEDIIFLTRYLLYCKGIANYNSHDYKYVQRSTSIMNTSPSLEKKMLQMEAIDEITSYIEEERRNALRDKWRGQRVLITMNMARLSAKEKKFWQGYKEFKIMAKHRISQDACRSISIKSAKIKYKVSIGLLKMKWYFAFYLCIWMLIKMGKLGNDVV